VKPEGWKNMQSSFSFSRANKYLFAVLYGLRLRIRWANSARYEWFQLCCTLVQDFLYIVNPKCNNKPKFSNLGKNKTVFFFRSVLYDRHTITISNESNYFCLDLSFTLKLACLLVDSWTIFSLQTGQCRRPVMEISISQRIFWTFEKQFLTKCAFYDLV